MKFGIHETMEMHEVLRESVSMIDHYAMYLNQCQDQDLRNILERQQRHMIDDYQRKINVMQGHGIDTTTAPRLSIESTGIETNRLTNTMGPQYGIQRTTPIHPNPDSRRLNDRSIAQGALLFHKCGAVRSTNAALECAEPHLRDLLMSSARSCMEMSYELFQYMNQRGWYQVPEMPRQFINHMQNTYQSTTHQFS
ncbi:spore coat protein [Desulfolucanica intricata]|uniref:spore coat protein n=1 Tax=Desulfolucanica intricata TaxID=1285191 RepID=UPI000834D55C|nr:spore coat protein [Desulfolucanica intricata]